MLNFCAKVFPIQTLINEKTLNRPNKAVKRKKAAQNGQ
jgi:hypothetical protein